MKTLEELLYKIDSYIPYFSLKNSKVSSATVGWQIEHLLLVLDAVINNIVKSNPANYKWKFSLIKQIIFVRNKISRGKAKAPKTVLPQEHITELLLKAHLKNTSENVKKLYALSQGNYFNHPLFGNVKLNDTFKFLKIHTQHHLDIIKDIVAKQ